MFFKVLEGSGCPNERFLGCLEVCRGLKIGVGSVWRAQVRMSGRQVPQRREPEAPKGAKMEAGGRSWSPKVSQEAPRGRPRERGATPKDAKRQEHRGQHNTRSENARSAVTCKSLDGSAVFFVKFLVAKTREL